MMMKDTIVKLVQKVFTTASDLSDLARGHEDVNRAEEATRETMRLLEMRRDVIATRSTPKPKRSKQ